MTYVGLTKNALSKRIAKHICNDRSHIGRALNKYGIDVFTITTIDSADTTEALNEKECYWISKVSCKYPSGYNHTDGGEGTNGHTWSVESKNRLSNSIKGHHVSDETREKIKNKRKLQVTSEETKRKISEAMKGKLHASGWHHTEEARIKITKASVGRKHTEETKKKMGVSQSGSGNGFYGGHHTAVMKKKMSDLLTGRKLSEEHKKKIGAANKRNEGNI